MVVRTNTQFFEEHSVLDDRIAFAKIMHTLPCYSLAIVREILTAYRSDHNRLDTHFLCFLDEVADIFLIGLEWRGATIVYAANTVCCTLFNKVCLEFLTVCTIVFLIIVGKLDKQEVTSLHLVLTTLDQRVPETRFHIERLTRSSRLTTIVDRDVIQVEELLKHLSPAALVSATVGNIFRHGGITDSMYFLLWPRQCY